jgi:hypothetical protein
MVLMFSYLQFFRAERGKTVTHLTQWSRKNCKRRAARTQLAYHNTILPPKVERVSCG